VVISSCCGDGRLMTVFTTRGRDPMVVDYKIIYVISAYDHKRCELKSRSW